MKAEEPLPPVGGFSANSIGVSSSPKGPWKINELLLLMSLSTHLCILHLPRPSPGLQGGRKEEP